MEEPKISEDKKIHKIRTFKDDLANAVRSSGVSSAKIAIKEQQRRLRLDNEIEESKFKPSKIFMVIFSFIFILVAMGIFLILKINPSLSFLNKEKVVITKETVPMFESTTKIFINPSVGKPVMIEAFDKLLEKGVGDKIQIFDFYTKSGEIEILATTSEFFNYLSINQEQLEWSIEKISYGLDGSKPFLLVEMSNFENTFAGMFNWETNRMISNLESIFPNIREEIIVEEIPNPDFVIDIDRMNNEEDESVIDENNEGETVEEIIPETITKQTTTNWRENLFIDEILYNKDSRVLRNEDGEVGIVYTFIDDKYLLISTDILTIKKVIDTINKYYIANY